MYLEKLEHISLVSNQNSASIFHLSPINSPKAAKSQLSFITSKLPKIGSTNSPKHMSYLRLQTPHQLNSINCREISPVGKIFNENIPIFDDDKQLSKQQIIRKISKSQPRVSKNLPSVFFTNLDKKIKTK